MIDLNARVAAYEVMRGYGFDVGDREGFIDMLLDEAAIDVVREIDRFGPPDFRGRFVRHLLWHMGAPNSELVEQVADIAARVSAPDYYGEQIVSIVVKGATRR